MCVCVVYGAEKVLKIMRSNFTQRLWSLSHVLWGRMGKKRRGEEEGRGGGEMRGQERRGDRIPLLHL